MKLPKPYYQDDAVTLYHGDNRSIVPLLHPFDLLLTDPPYGLDIASRFFDTQRASLGTVGGSWDRETAPMLAEFFERTDSQVVWGGNYYPLPCTRGWLSWHKPDAPPSMGNFELAWTSRDAIARQFSYSIAATNPERLGHPTQKPLALISWCLSFFPEAQTVLDPFAGSGTTGRACKDRGLKCTLIEREESYCEIIAKRMGQEVMSFTAQPKPESAEGESWTMDDEPHFNAPGDFNE